MTLTNDHASGFTRINLWKINEYIESSSGMTSPLDGPTKQYGKIKS